MDETFQNYYNFSTEQSYTATGPSTSPIDHTLMGRERSVQKGEQMEFPVYHFHEDGTITLSSTEYPGRFVYVPEDQISYFARTFPLPVSRSNCPQNCLGKRQEMKKIVARLEEMAPRGKDRVTGALDRLLASDWDASTIRKD